jgi:hypothetical protein
MVQIVNADEVKAALLIEHNEQDGNIMLQIGAATEILEQYLTEPDDTWTPDTAPERVKAAVILMVGNLLYNPGQPALSEAVRAVLADLRDPPMA